MAKKRKGGKGKAPAAAPPAAPVEPAASLPIAEPAAGAPSETKGADGGRPVWGLERHLPARVQVYFAQVGAKTVRRTTLVLIAYGLFMLSVAYWPARTVRGELLRLNDLDREMWIKVPDGAGPGPEWKIAIYPDTKVSLKDSPELFTWLDMQPGDTLDLTYWPTLYGRRLSKAIVVTRRTPAGPGPVPSPTASPR